MTNTTRPAYGLASDPRPLWQDSPTRYGAISRLNHWVTAAVFLGALGLGLVMAYGGLTREAVAPLMAWHKFLGVLVLVYGIWRVAWRMRQGFPEPVASMPRWQRAASKAVHFGPAGRDRRHAGLRHPDDHRRRPRPDRLGPDPFAVPGQVYLAQRRGRGRPRRRRRSCSSSSQFTSAAP